MRHCCAIATACLLGLLGTTILDAPLHSCGWPKMPAFVATSDAISLPRIWVNDGQDKVTQDELRLSNGRDVRNSVWDGNQISLFGAKNEVVSCNIIIESPEASEAFYSVEAESLEHENGLNTIYKKQSSTDVFSYVNRNIELFYIRYLPIKGLSRLAYSPMYDERHVPERLRLPYSLPKGTSRGKFGERPDANKMYPDIAVPMEIVRLFKIGARNNQSIWVDIYIPRDALPGDYHGGVSIMQNGNLIATIPLRLKVHDFALPDAFSAKTMVWLNEEDVYARYTGVRWDDSKAATPEIHERMDSIWKKHFQMAKRHRISLITGGNELLNPRKQALWMSVFDGSLFGEAQRYEGPGKATPGDVFSLGTYGSWRSVEAWGKGASMEKMQQNADKWVAFFERNAPTVQYFLYLLDEPKIQDFAAVERWAAWLKSNAGPGRRLKSLCTTSLVNKLAHCPSVDISFMMWGDADSWRKAVAEQRKNNTEVMAYNGWRPSSGTFMIEDDGVALRVNGWIHYKHEISRWFFWAGTNYKNPSFVNRETNVFQEAATFGRIADQFHEKYGETGAGYGNGDGLLFYPGTDVVYPNDSYNISGPIASLRLKHWRRGLQDYEYLTLAATKDTAAVHALVQRMIPTSLWELGVTDKSDPTYVHADISWSTNPDAWEAARRELVDIILQ